MRAFIAAVQGVVMVFGEKGLFLNKQSRNRAEFAYILAPFLHEFGFFFECVREDGFKHRL